MELKEFVKETIIQITDGIREGQQYITENQFGEGVRDDKAKEINFDIAVSTDTSDTVGGGGKISVASFFNAGANAEQVNKSSNLSRIQFKLYVKINAS